MDPLSKRFDLNLLQVLEVLLEEENVTAASKRLNLTQSAVSKHLARLRVMFDDTLFDRTSNGLKATPRALELAPRIRALSRDLDSLVHTPEFNPMESQRRFKIDALETTHSLVFPNFMPRLLLEAPAISIETRIWDQDSMSRLVRCETDLGLAYREWDKRSKLHMSQLPPSIHCAQLLHDETVCLMRTKHPVRDQKWNLNSLLHPRHIQVTFEGMNRWLLDEILAGKGRRRDVAIAMPDFYSAMTLCEQTDLLLCAPKRHANRLLPHFDLIMREIPLEIKPGAYALLWHDHFEEDQGHRWLRALICSQMHDVY